MCAPADLPSRALPHTPPAAHQGDIYTLSTSKDGLYIASGGADKNVSVWTWELAEKYKFSHAESVQAVAFNPVVANLLATASSIDFAVWTMPSASLRKLKLPSKALCAAWTSNGQFLAIGMLSGAISVRDSTGVEKMVLERPGPVWDLSFSAPRGEEGVDSLVVACWDGSVSFYSLTGQTLYPDRASGAEQCTARYLSSGDFLVAGGADRKATLYSRDGIKLGLVAEGKDWIWKAVPRPRTNSVAIACNDGTVSVHTIVFSTVHGLYGERYAYRDNMTHVVVQHLLTEGRTRIKCNDFVRKIAVYMDRLAVQLSDRVIIYELVSDAPSSEGGEASSTALLTGMNYRVKSRIDSSLECNLLVVTSRNVVLCLDKKLALYDFNGVKEREWTLEAVIRYIKVVGGPAGREGLLVGLKNGAVSRIFVDNPFPVLLIRHRSSIRCLDLSASRRKLALVDDTASVFVYDIVTGQQAWSEAGANSVAWNSFHEDMLAYSGNGVLTTKTGAYPLHSQKLAGFVVGFEGSKISCLHSLAMQTVDVPHSASIARYIEDKEWDAAYRTACLGATPADWSSLGESAMRSLSTRIARYAYARVKDTRCLELVNFLDAAVKGGKTSPPSLLAEVEAYGGRFVEASRAHLAGGTVDRAVEMLTDLRLWEQARTFAEESGRVDVSLLLMKQAAWCEEAGDAKAAATIYAGLGQATKAVALLSSKGMDGALLDLMRSLPSDPAAADWAPAGSVGAGPVRSVADAIADASSALTADVREALATAGTYFRRANSPESAREAFTKLGDVQALLSLLIEAGAWEDALALSRAVEASTLRKLQIGGDRGRVASAARVEGKGGRDLTSARALVAQVHLAHAEALAMADEFEAAQACYEAAGRPDRASVLTAHLADNAIAEDRWEDASFHFHRLSSDTMAALEESLGREGKGAPFPSRLVSRYLRLRHDADVYRAFSVVHHYVTAPFTSTPPTSVFHAACFVLNASLGGIHGPPPRLPFGVSPMVALWALARQAASLEAWHVAAFALDRVSALLVPTAWREQLELGLLRVQTKPARDAEGLTHTCPRCAAPVPLITVSGPSCVAVPTPPPLLPPHRREAGGHVVDAFVPDRRDAAFLSTDRPTSSHDACPACSHLTVRSSRTWEPLALVACVPEDGRLAANADELLDVIGSRVGVPPAAKGKAGSGQQVLVIAEVQGGDGLEGALARVAVLALDSAAAGLTGGACSPVVSLPTDVLAALRRSDVLLPRLGRASSEGIEARARGEGVLPPTLYVNLRPTVPIATCDACCRFFHAEDLEFEVLRHGRCPLCRGWPG